MFVYFRRKGGGKKLGKDPRQADEIKHKGSEKRKSILTPTKSSDKEMHHNPGLTKQREQVLERAISLLETQIVYRTLQEKASK